MLGAVGTIEELRALIKEQPDLLVIDLRMKPMDGLAMLEQLRKEGCTIPAVMLTMSDSEVDLGNAIRAGVRGYLLKDMAPEEVVDAIRRVAAGELVVAPTMTDENDRHAARRSTRAGAKEFSQTAHRARTRNSAIAVPRRKQQGYRAVLVDQL